MPAADLGGQEPKNITLSRASPAAQADHRSSFRTGSTDSGPIGAADQSLGPGEASTHG
jgi:hypothetical protein